MPKLMTPKPSTRSGRALRATHLTTPVRRACGLVTASALAIGGLLGPLGATATQAAPGGAFASSFETTDPPALVIEPYTPPVGISGPTEPQNSVMSHVVRATAGTENTAAGEVVANIVDGNSRTKWLSTSVAPWWAIYETDEPVLIREYTLTSANDSVERDPAAWTIAGSNDGTTWTTLDSRTGQSFAARYEVRQFDITQPVVDDNVTYQAYKFFRFNVTARGGGGNGSQMMQLGDWTLYAGTEVPPPPTPPTIAVGSGPSTGFDIRANVGFEGVRSLSFGGTLKAAAAKASAVVYKDLNVAIGTESELSYAIFPTLDGPSYTYLSTYAAIDLEVTDADGTNPTLMSLTPGIVDQYGFPASALGQGTSKILVSNFWNSMKVDLSALAGKKVTKILFTYETNRGEPGTAVSAWVDSIKIADAVRINPSSLTNYVDVRRGTWGGMSESRGINIPATTVPNGFNYLMPMTGSNDAGREQYYYMSHNTAANLTPLRGLIISHQPSPHIQDRLTMAFMPSLSQSGTPNAALTNRQLTFTHSNETAQPDIYRVITEEGLTAEMTPTDHGGVMRFTFPETNTAGSLIADRQGWDATFSWAADGTLTGYTDGGYGNNTGRSRMFIYGSVDCTPTATGTGTGRTQSRWARCDLGDSKQMQFRFATSYLSQAQAQHNFAAEVPWARTFETVQAATRAEWNQRLSVIDFSGSSANDTAKRTVYSDLYRLNTYPSSHFENTADPGETPVYKFASPVNPTSGAASATETNAEIRSGRMYTNNGFWDTYRSAWPAYAMFYPDSSDGIIDGIVEQYRSGGWISRWTAPGYVDAMTGTSSDASFAEAYVAGALPTDIALDAYDAAVKNATVLPTSPFSGMPAANVGRKGWSTAPYQGYTDTSLTEAVSWGMEGDINDAAIAKMAAKLATDPATPEVRRGEIAAMAEYLARRAQNYSNYFDPSIGFFQGVTRAGDFQRPAAGYDPTSWSYGFTESNAWTFAFHAPFDVAGMAALYGSQDALVNKVHELIDTPDRQNTSSKEQHEARDTRLGQLGISNQTSYHIPYIPAAAGKPALTQRIMRDAVGRLESGGDIGQGYLGDEDNGAMASWYLYAALGFYPLNLASGEYTIGSPAYDKMTVRFEGGGSLTINAPGNSQATWYVAGVKLDGVALTEAKLKQADILDGGDHVLDFTMSPTATTWGETELTPVDPIPPRDATKAGYGTVAVSDGTASQALTDDNSATTATFAAEAADVRWSSEVGPLAVARYTLTNGPSGSDPQAWTLYGSDDGATWTVVDARQGETFRWDTQLRPFTVASPVAYSEYKLAITATSDGAPATVAEVELLVEPASESTDDLTIASSSERTTTVGAAHAIALGRVLGGSGDPGAIEARVDFGDGTSGSATATRSPLGGVTLTVNHAYAIPGVYSVVMTVSDGAETATGTVPVYARPLTGIGEAFDNSCLTEVGVPVPCDDANTGLGIARLAAAGYVQGQSMALGGTGLTFTPPVTRPGDTDNVMTPGVTFPIDLGAGATRVSVVGMATNAPDEGLTGTGTILFADGSTQAIEVSLGNWATAAADVTPIPGNSTLVQVDRRIVNGTEETGNATRRAAFFYTDPVTLAPATAGAQAIAFTMPASIEGANSTWSRVHVLGIASDGGAGSAPLVATPGTPLGLRAVGADVTADLATLSGGPAGTTYSATVNWGDGTPTVAADVVDGTVSASHTYATAGEFTVTVIGFNGATSIRASVPVRVIANSVLWPVLRLVVNTYSLYEAADWRYTPASFEPLAEALAEARALLAVGLADNAEVQAAIDTLTAAANGLVEDVDRSTLAALLAKAEAMLANQSAYLPAHIQDLREAVEAARLALADPLLTQEGETAAAIALATAMHGVTPRGDKTGLIALITVIEGLDATRFTPGSWAGVTSALEAGRLVVADTDASMDTVDAAFTSLQEATGALVLRAGKSGLLSALTVARSIMAAPDRYYPASLVGLPEALSQAETVYADLNATASEVTVAQSALIAAVATVRVRPISPQVTSVSPADLLPSGTYVAVDGIASGPAATGLSPADGPGAATATSGGPDAGPPAAAPNAGAVKAFKVFKAAKPRITGVKAVGRKVKAKAGAWSPKPELSYQWYRSGKPIAKATKAVYKLTAKDRGKRITVKVTAHRAGFKQATRTSPAITIRH